MSLLLIGRKRPGLMDIPPKLLLGENPARVQLVFVLVNPHGKPANVLIGK
jgi:hypothetical protein